MASLKHLTDDVDRGEQNHQFNNDVNNTSIIDKCKQEYHHCASCQTCGAISTAFVSTGQHFKYFWHIIFGIIVWTSISFLVVGTEKSYHWDELEELFEKREVDYERNMTNVLIKTTAAILLNYTENISIFMVFHSIITSTLCGMGCAMIVFRYSELYTSQIIGNQSTTL